MYQDNVLMNMVSVIIPVYNVEAYVERCLHSVIAQVQVAVEIIIVDDCGTDQSLNIVESVLGHTTSCNYSIEHHTTNRGLSAARNTGLAVAKGKYVYFLDSDDWLKKETALHRLVDTAEKYRSACVVGEYQECEDMSGKALHTPYQYGGVRHLDTSPKVIACFVDNVLPVTAWNKLVRKSFLLKQHLSFKEGILHEDCLWTFQLMVGLPSLTLVPEVTYCYSVNPDSIMNKVDEVKIKWRVDSSGIVLDEMEKAIHSLRDDSLNGLLSVYIDETRNYMYRRLLMDGLAWKDFKPFYRKTHRPMKRACWYCLSLKLKVAHMDQLLPVCMGRYYFLFLYKFLYKK